MSNALIEAAGKAFKAPFGAVLELRPDQGAPVFIDGRKTPPAANASPPADHKEADCIWRSQAETLTRLLTSGRGVDKAIVSGRLIIAGDVSVMARIELGDA